MVSTYNVLERANNTSLAAKGGGHLVCTYSTVPHNAGNGGYM